MSTDPRNRLTNLLTIAIALNIALGIFAIPAMAQTNTFPTTGNAGIGTLSPVSLLQVKGGGSGTTPGVFETDNGGVNGLLITSARYGFVVGSSATDNTYAFAVYSGVSRANGTFFGGAATLFCMNNGTVGIRTASPSPSFALDVNGSVNVTGNMNVTGNLAAKYQDVAEWVQVSEPMNPATVVVLNPEKPNEVMPANRPYDTSVAGVVSERPGLILGEQGASKAQIATYGRVRVKVDATKNPIKIGDLLVTSGTTGLAMKSEPLEIRGRAFHQPGTIIGKALEPLASGKGEILVLLSLQ